MVHLISILASNIKARRKSLGLTQEKLAEMINTAPTYIAMIEAERRTPSFNMIERLAKALNIDAPKLFSMNNYPSEPASQIHENLLSQFDKFLRAVSIEIGKPDH
jgi:transcriptional regulator with XRE-family HTH domain